MDSQLWNWMDCNIDKSIGTIEIFRRTKVDVLRQPTSLLSIILACFTTSIPHFHHGFSSFFPGF